MDNAAFGIEHKLRLEVGPGRVAEVARLVASLTGAATRVLLISDRGVAATGMVERVFALLRCGGHDAILAADLAGEPDAAAVDAHAALARASGAGLVLGLGGGSALDLAKLAASLAGGGSAARDHALARTPLPAGLPVVAVPTTAGTGAEVTATAIFSDHRRKLWAHDTPLRPTLALLDPELTLGLPPSVTAAGGLDAIVHGLEAATSRRRNPLSETYGLRAVRLGHRALARCIERPDDLAARGTMLLASCLAGLAIDIAGTGAAHALGHAAGSVGKVPHGLAVALGLRACIAWNAEGEPGRHVELAHTLDLAGDRALADRLDEWWRRTIDAAGAGDLIEQARVRLTPHREQLGTALSTEENRPMLDANARPAGSADLDLLLDRLLAA